MDAPGRISLERAYALSAIMLYSFLAMRPVIGAISAMQLSEKVGDTKGSTISVLQLGYKLEGSALSCPI